jgi:hypothetical protein
VAVPERESDSVDVVREAAVGRLDIDIGGTTGTAAGEGSRFWKIGGTGLVETNPGRGALTAGIDTEADVAEVAEMTEMTEVVDVVEVAAAAKAGTAAGTRTWTGAGAGAGAAAVVAGEQLSTDADAPGSGAHTNAGGTH